MAFASLNNQGAGAPQAEINMVPLIDVMLVLLVIFIVAAPMLTHSVPVNLPKASSAATQVAPQRVTVSISESGQVFWEHSAVSAVELDVRMKQAASQPDTQVLLHADHRVSYGTVAQTLAAASRVGLTHIAFVSEPEVRAP